MGLRLLRRFWNCECIEIRWTCHACLPLHPFWCWFNSIKMKISCVLGCTGRTITSRSREVTLPLCSAPVRHICSAGSCSGSPLQKRQGHTGPAKGQYIGQGLGHVVWGEEEEGGEDLFAVFSYLTGLRRRQCWASQECPAKGQEAERGTPGRCKKNVLDVDDMASEQGSRRAVKLLPVQILISQLDKALSTPI